MILKISDNGQPRLTDEAAVLISIANVNERPNVENQERSVEENTPRTTKVGMPIPSTDPDNIPLGTYTLEEQQLLYKLTLSDGSPSPEFKIGACGGQVEVKQANILDYETKITYVLKIVVTDDGLDPAQLSDFAVLTVTVIDINEPPVLLDAARAVNENSDVNDNVGTPVIATDPDVRAPQGLTYTIEGGNDLGLFKVVRCLILGTRHRRAF